MERKLKYKIKLTQPEKSLYERMYEDYLKSNIHSQLAEVESEATGTLSQSKKKHIVREVL